MKYLITTIGYPRSGTNYLMGVLDNSFFNINSNSELFNREKCFINNKYESLMCNHYNVTDLTKVSKSKPLLFLDTLIEVSEEPVLSQKIFPAHLELNTVYKIIDKSAYLLIMKRNFTDVYISHKRAISMLKTCNNPWVYIDTTNYKVTFNKEEFERQKQIFNEWYDSTLNYITKNNKNYFIINYETFHELSLSDKQVLLRKKLSEVMPSDLLDITTTIEPLNKQDKSSDYQTKFSNYEEFKEYMNI